MRASDCVYLSCRNCYERLLLFQIPFKLTLRVWDIFILEGEKVLTAMAYNILKLHRKRISQLGMDDILQFLQVEYLFDVRVGITSVEKLIHESGLIQVKLPKNFEYADDVTIESLQRCMEDLKKNKLDYAGSPPAEELPKKPFGVFKPDHVFEQKVSTPQQQHTR